MLKKLVVIGGIAAVAGLGLAGAAWAGSGSSSPAGVAANSSVALAASSTKDVPTTASAPAGTAHKGKKGKHAGRARHLEGAAHGQWVSKDAKTGAFVTHDAVRGDVSAVSATSITIKAADGTSETFVVNGSTKVHVKGATNPPAGTSAQAPIATIGAVKVGDKVGVLGTGAGTMTATNVIDHGIAGAPKEHKKAAAGPTATTAPTTS